MNEYKDIKRLHEIKMKLKDKEDNILQSQIREHKLEHKTTKLEYKRHKMLGKKTSIIKKIISYLIYDLIIMTILILFISNLINILNIVNKIPNSIYILSIYLEVTLVSILGAYLSAKIEPLLIKNFTQKRIRTITRKIEYKKKEIELERNKQQMLKQEITNIINYFDNIVPANTINISNNTYNNYNKEYRYELNEEVQKKRKKRIKNIHNKG